MTHDQVRELVRRVNPIPDPKALEDVVTSVPVTRQERRTDMQTDDRVMVEGGGENRWRGPLVGIAVAAVILVAGAVFFLTRNDTPVAEPAPNATRLSGEEAGPIGAGAYFADTDGDEGTTTRGTFVIEGKQWEGFEPGAMKVTDSGDIVFSMMVLEVERVSKAHCDGGAMAPAGTSAKALADQFAAMSGVITREALTPVSAFGHDGYHLVLEVPGDCPNDRPGGWSSPAFFVTDRTYGDGNIVEYWFLDVEGNPVMVEATQWSSPPKEEAEAELRAVLDTIVITP